MLAAGSVSAQTFNATGVGAIPDPTGTPACGNTSAAPLNSTIAVSGVTGPITAISVSVTFSPAHSWGGDVTATLIAPGGSPSHILFGRRNAAAAPDCGTANDLAGPYVFVDPAVNPASFWAAAGNPIAAGTYATSLPGGAAGGGTNSNFTAVFSGLTPAQINGNWTLRFNDTGVGDTGTVSAASMTIVAGPGSTPPQFSYIPAAASTVTATGGGAVGSTGTLTITPSIGTAGTGTGAAATTTLTCTAPTAPFSGFGQSVTAVGDGAISGGPLTGSCTVGASVATQVLVCNENRGGTNNERTWTLSCPAGTVVPPPPAVVQAVDTLGNLAKLLMLLAVLGVGIVALRRH
jgi:subtilisin-like proprotein convertase family protein